MGAVSGLKKEIPVCTQFRSAMNLVVVILAALLGILLPTESAQAQAQSTRSISFKYTSFDYPAAIATQAMGISQKGVIAGYYLDASSAEHAFVRLPDGKFEEVDYPGAVGTILFDINDSKEAVGLYNGTDSFNQGFLFERPNQFTPIYYSASASSTTPYGINNSGQIVGAWSGDGLQGGFSLVDGTYTELLYPNAEFTYPNDVNSSGMIVGSWVSVCNPSCQYHGFTLTSAVDGTYTSFDFPGAIMTFANAINDSNQVVGWYEDDTGAYHGWIGVPSKNQYTQVDYPGASFTAVGGINNARHVVGWYVDTNDVGHGFIAVPK